MTDRVKAPSGRDIWRAVREELRLNLYELPYSTLAPTVYHVYLHPDDFHAVEGIVPRVVSELQEALTADVERMNRRLTTRRRRVIGRLLQRDDIAPVEGPAAGWDVRIAPDQDGEVQHGQLGIISSLVLPAAAAYGGTPTARIVKSVVAAGHRTSTTTDVSECTDARQPAGSSDRGPRARLTYDDDQGRHEFVMQKDALVVGRGGSSAWVDVQVVTSAKASREHFRIRRDASGRFFIQDVSLWGTSVNGEPLPPAVKSGEGVVQPGAEHELPSPARIGVADALEIQFEAAR